MYSIVVSCSGNAKNPGYTPMNTLHFKLIQCLARLDLDTQNTKKRMNLFDPDCVGHLATLGMVHSLAEI